LYGGETERYENALYEDNTIILKAWEGCDPARGIWTATGEYNKGAIYRRNTVKVEAISDKINFTNVNISLTCVDINGDDLPLSDPLPPPIIFEDNRLIGNVNLITFGSSYGIGGSAHFYRTKMEKINHTDAYFAPVRLGYWYWNTRDNYLIDAIPGEGVDLEKAPVFHGSSGFMEVFYGQTKKLYVTDRCDGIPLCNTAITIKTDGRQPIATRTDNDGYVTFEMITVRHLKADNVISRTDYAAYTFTLAGHPDCTVATATLKTQGGIALSDPSCDSAAGIEGGEKNKRIVYPNPASEHIYINGLSGNEIITVTDITGRLLHIQKATAAQEQIQVSNFPSGLYLIRIEGTIQPETFKVFVFN
jgi:hypothetical protein